MACIKNGYSMAERLERAAAPDLRVVTPHSLDLELTRRRTFWSPSPLTMRDLSNAGRTAGTSGAAVEEEALGDATAEAVTFFDAAAAFLGAIAHERKGRRR
jgi:hypothetical protein